jgi:RNA polymerase sigma-70 factor (ECF subfamily)
MDGRDEATLVRRAQSGDTRAFDRLVLAFGSVVYSLALRMTGNHEDARDVAQRTFMSAWRGLAGFDSDRRFYSWLYRIARNESLNFLRARRPTEPLGDDRVDPGPSADADLNARECRDAISEALRSLPAEQRELLLLRYTAELSYREIAELLEIREPLVRSRLFTARQAMGRLLEQLGWTKP